MAAASLYTTPADCARFLAALLGDAALFRDTLASPVTVDAELGLDRGLDWGIERSARADSLWRWGSIPGYRAVAMANAAHGDVLVLLINSERGPLLAAPLTAAELPGEHRAFEFRMIR